MPKITSIKPQVKRTDRYSIFVDGKYSFSLSEAEVLNSKIVPNQEVTAEQLAQLKDTAKLDKGFGRALNLLSHRPRSEWELRDYLKRKEYEPEEITIILNKLSKYGYVDDVAFAKLWVENRRLLKPVSQRRLRQELQQKRIPSDVIDQTISSDSEVTDERAVLRELVAKKRSRYPDRQKLMQYLARQGFSYDAIKDSLQE